MGNQRRHSKVLGTSVIGRMYGSEPRKLSDGSERCAADKSLSRPTFRCIFYDGWNISFDASLLIYVCIYIYIYIYIYIHTGCPRRKGPNFGRVFLRSNYTDITQNTYIQSSMVTEILNIEKCGLVWCLRTVLCP